MPAIRVAVLLLLCLGLARVAGAGEYDLVLSGGRLIDPESGTDAILNIGIQGDRIAIVTDAALSGQELLDVSGLVVAPGFIDLHSHSPTPLGQSLQLRDGVTTQLELEAGAYPVDYFGARIAAAPLQNYGASVGFAAIRFEVMMGVRQPRVPGDDIELLGIRGRWTAVRSLFGEVRDGYTRRSSPAQREQMRLRLNEGLDAGGIGIGLPLDYISEAVDAGEMRMIFEVAAARQAPVFVHIRRGVNGDPAGLEEVLELAHETGAPLHVCHIQHNAMRNTEGFLAEIRRARDDGLDVTTEAIPYNAGSTFISAAVFDRDWQTIFGISYGDVQWSATGERLDRASWEKYRREQPHGQIIHHYVDESWTRRALAEPGVMVVSDILPIDSLERKSTPHGGSFARVLGHYVREQQLLELPDALARMTLLPARRLERIAPAFARKGRIKVGADADLTVFNADTVAGRSSYAEPYVPSAGIPFVIVNGVVVVRDGEIAPGVAPGRRLLASDRAAGSGP
jgi:hypothetical protein